MQNEHDGYASRHDRYANPSPLLQLFLLNPFLLRPDDETSERTLVSWLVKMAKEYLSGRVTVSDAEKFLNILTKDGILASRLYGPHPRYKGTRNYFLLKRGEAPIFVEKKETPIHPWHLEQPRPSQPEGPAEIREKSETEPLSPVSCFGALLKKIDRYSGRDKEAIRAFPPLLELACRILNDPYTDWHSKIIISSALGYFVLEDDIHPDHEEFGLLDDLYIITYALREMEQHVSPRVIEDKWPYREYVHDLIEDTFRTCSSFLKSDACEVLHKVGLLKFKELRIEEYTGQYQPKVAKLAREKRQLIAICAYLMKQLFSDLPSNKLDLEVIRQTLVEYGDYDEIQRIIALSERDHLITGMDEAMGRSYDDEVQERLRISRLRVFEAD